jgi:hypothetical protein
VYQLDGFYDAADELGVLLYHVRSRCKSFAVLRKLSNSTVVVMLRGTGYSMCAWTNRRS